MTCSRRNLAAAQVVLSSNLPCAAIGSSLHISLDSVIKTMNNVTPDAVAQGKEKKG